MHWKKVALVGVGLLGGSLGLALRQRRLANQVVGYVRRPAGAAECERLGVVDAAGADLMAAVREADLVVLCTPLAQMRGLSERLLPGLSSGVLVTDVGSVKGSVMSELEPMFAEAGVRFIGSHPMAGGEKMGAAAARADLFEKAVCVLTPAPNCPREDVEKLELLWKGVGAVPLQLSPDMHDDLVSRSSHLPHVVAAALANYVLSPAHPKEQAMLCANGFKDTTRIAAGSPDMWRDICLANRKHLLRVLGVYIEDLNEFRHALDTDDALVIEEFFVQAKLRRERWCSSVPGPSPTPE